MTDISLVNCKFDIIFKFLLVRNPLLVKIIIQGVTKKNPNSLTFLNPEILPPSYDGKLIIYDSFLQDESGQYYDIEMQNSPLYDYLLPRFHFYSADMITQQIPKGGDYFALKPTYQIIFIEDIEEGQGLIKEVTPKDQDGKEEQSTHQHTYLVYMPYINVIAQRKGLKNLNLFEKSIYAIENNFEDGILELGGEVLNCMHNNLKEFMTDEQHASYLRAYKGSRMIIDGYHKAINDRDKAINSKKEAIAEKKQAYLHSIDVLVKELNISAEEAMIKLNISKEMLS